MPMYARDEPTECRPIDRWAGGVGWLAHPHEDGRRASHAIGGDDGVWLVDPLDAPGVDDLIEPIDEIVGVAVLSDFHARDAAVFAERYGVSVHVPRWLNRATARIDAPIEQFTDEIGDSGFRVRNARPFPGCRESIAYHESNGTLYAPDVLSTELSATVGDERIALFLPGRLFPPRHLFGDLRPERILLGHGTGIFDDATAALMEALDGARRRFPQALVTSGWTQLRAGIAALGD